MKTDSKGRIALDMHQPDALRKGFGGENVYPISHSLPFYIGSGPKSRYVHRVRSSALHNSLDKPHVSVSFWCGGSGFPSNGKGKLLAEVPAGEVVCATCEGRYIGAGLGDAGRQINGRKVMYQPRKYE